MSAGGVRTGTAARILEGLRHLCHGYHHLLVEFRIGLGVRIDWAGGFLQLVPIGAHPQRIDRHLFALPVNRHLEPVCQEMPQHQVRLVPGGPGRHFGDDVELRGTHPGRTGELIVHDPVCLHRQIAERHMGAVEPDGVRGAARHPDWHGHGDTVEVRGCGRLDRRHLELRIGRGFLGGDREGREGQQASGEKRSCLGASLHRAPSRLCPPQPSRRDPSSVPASAPVDFEWP